MSRSGSVTVAIAKGQYVPPYQRFLSGIPIKALKLSKPYNLVMRVNKLLLVTKKKATVKVDILFSGQLHVASAQLNKRRNSTLDLARSQKAWARLQ